MTPTRTVLASIPEEDPGEVADVSRSFLKREKAESFWMWVEKQPHKDEKHPSGLGLTSKAPENWPHVFPSTPTAAAIECINNNGFREGFVGVVGRRETSANPHWWILWDEDGVMQPWRKGRMEDLFNDRRGVCASQNKAEDEPTLS